MFNISGSALLTLKDYLDSHNMSSSSSLTPSSSSSLSVNATNTSATNGIFTIIGEEEDEDLNQTMLYIKIHHPKYDISKRERIHFMFSNESMQSGQTPTTFASLTVIPTPSPLSMEIELPSELKHLHGLLSENGTLRESVLRQGGVKVVLRFKEGGETFSALNLKCLWDSWVSNSTDASLNPSGFAVRKALMIPYPGGVTLVDHRTVQFTFMNGRRYNTIENEIIHFNMTKAAECRGWPSGVTPQPFIQGNTSWLRIAPGIFVQDGPASVHWDEPLEYRPGTHTASITEADVRSGFSLTFRLTGDMWQTSSSAMNSIFRQLPTMFKTRTVDENRLTVHVNAPEFEQHVVRGGEGVLKSVVISDDASEITYTFNPIPSYNIASTETVLIHFMDSTTVGGSVISPFHGDCSLCRGLLLKVQAYKVEFSLQSFTHVVGAPFTAVARFYYSGWNETDITGSQADTAIQYVPAPTFLRNIVVGGPSRLEGHQ
jgi:hypothetical protein